MNKNNGITLIALVITIVITIILAGVTINGISQKNGLIDSIERAKNDVENDNKKENDKINNYENSNSGDKLHSIEPE